MNSKPATYRPLELFDKVEKLSGDYTFKGVVVSKYQKLSGAWRFVVEDDRGINMIYSEKNLTRVRH